jgi:hypothetical protein
LQGNTFQIADNMALGELVYDSRLLLQRLFRYSYCSFYFWHAAVVSEHL